MIEDCPSLVGLVSISNFISLQFQLTFDHSDKPFEIKYNEDMYSDTAVVTSSPGHGGTVDFMDSIFASSFTNLSNSNERRSTVSKTTNPYYIYTFDGRLLAEYDWNGSCVGDYIYSGNRLIAEYKPQTNEYFYYMNDQINSTRIITNGSGNVVFSEAAGPYGDIQKTWTNAYEPKLKFSGKEREGYSGLDYFGARYFDHKSYRFNSVDPIINKEEALSNPQLWNLYAYCDNSPITYLDPDGRVSESMPMKYEEQFAKSILNKSNDPVVNMLFLGAVGFNVGYFAGPEIIASIGTAGATLLKWGTKTADFVSRIFKGNTNINYNKLFEALSKNNLKHIGKHLAEFQKYDPNMNLRKLVDLGHKIASNVKNLISTPGGRKVFEETVKIGGKSLKIRAVFNTADKLNSVHIR